jgi:hypothetical protein
MNITTGILGFFVLCCAYAAQYWVYKCCKELQKTNEKLDRLIEFQKR